MQIPIKVDYGVRALVDLARCTQKGPVRAADIARRATIPEPYLAQVLHTLNKSGLIQSQRGPHGGHALAMDPSEIRLSMVMDCLVGSQTMVGCLEDTSRCVHVPACAQREVWRSVEQAIYNILHTTSIGDLVERTRVLELKHGESKRGESKRGLKSPSERLDPVAV